ncbi:hypothetical protein HNR62_000331 [Oceanisphaera litoralis]|uniref:hypothetical protein n=1 Tax=Oceanisphaera litoralis TaxID=225144 RepID=UPI00195918D7|nr:hypothetical protein [Oceanisphaera litoralis]MBM7454502.1 hypothetical protein [Oceanisphaera litoralis]
MDCYQMMSVERAVDQLAWNEGMAQEREEALTAYCQEHLELTLWVMERDPDKAFDLWGALCESELPTDAEMNAAMARIATLDQEDMAMLTPKVQRYLTALRTRLHDLILAEGEDLFNAQEKAHELGNADC